MPPLTAERLLTAWTAPPAVVLGCLALAVAYAVGVHRMRRAGLGWPPARSVAWSGGVALLVLVGCSAVAVYDDILFWARAVQGVVLLAVAPPLLAGGAPLTLARATLPAPAVRVLGRVRRSRPARAVTAPGVVTAALVLPPFAVYLTGLYRVMLTNPLVSAVASAGLLACGCLYAASRLQVDPLPRHTHHGLTLVIVVVEIVADGVLGLVLWLGPLVPTGHDVERSWGPDPRTDQVIGAGVWWLGGDLAGLPFVVAIMSRFAAEDEARAEELDAQDDRRNPGDDPGDDPDGPEAARRRALWWQEDPYLADRFRRR